MLDQELERQPRELARILVHELFHFAWVRLGNPARRSYEALVREEWKQRARGELGWSAESRKRALLKGLRCTARRCRHSLARLPLRKFLRHRRLDLLGRPPASRVHAGRAASQSAGGMVSRRRFRERRDPDIMIEERSAVSKTISVIGVGSALACALLWTGCSDFAVKPAAKASQEQKPASSVQPECAVGRRSEFSLKDANGQTVHPADYKGKVVLLDFWATWCGPCKIEIPWFMDFEKAVQGSRLRRAGRLHG